MKLKFVDDFDQVHKKGFEVEVDKIKFDERYSGKYKVRVVSEWKRPAWLAITWFLNIPEEYI